MHVALEVVVIWLATCVAAGLGVAVWLATRPVGWRDRSDLPEHIIRPRPELTADRPASDHVD